MKEITAVLAGVSGPLNFSLELLDQIIKGMEVNVPVCRTLAMIFLKLAADKLSGPPNDGPKQGEQDRT